MNYYYLSISGPAMLLLLLFALLINRSISLKFLAVSPQMANSHVNFLGRVSDILIDAGHEVVMLSPVYDTIVGGPGTKKARVIEIPQTKTAKETQKMFQGQGELDIWSMDSKFGQIKNFDTVKELYVNVCEEVLLFPGLLEKLRNEHFDVAFGESYDLCWPGLFHLIGVKNYVFTDSMAMLDANFHVTQTPSLPSYVPTVLNGRYGEKMNLWQRAENTVIFCLWKRVLDRNARMVQDMFERNWPGFPDIVELSSNASLVFQNSEPLVDFPRPMSSRLVDIGGITVSSGHKPLNKIWSDILDLKSRTVLLSFGTFAKSYMMPELYKETIRQTLAKFPDVTFIWKYEKPEHNVSKGIANIIESTWVPQHDLLHDPRLTAFITHCGQGSTTEAYSAGIPLLVIPVLGDQLRNAQQVKRNGVGITLYRRRALEVKSMLEERPFTMKQIFVKNMEFVAKHGPLRQLDHYGRHLNFIQYYLIDVIAILSLLAITVLLLVTYIAYAVFRFMAKIIVHKKKTD